MPQTKRAAFTAADGARTEINFTWSEDAWQPEERAVQKTQPEFRRFTDLRCRWDAAKSEWRGCHKNVREETEQGRLKYAVSSLWHEESQRWEVVFENELSYDARGKVIKNGVSMSTATTKRATTSLSPCASLMRAANGTRRKGRKTSLSGAF